MKLVEPSDIAAVADPHIFPEKTLGLPGDNTYPHVDNCTYPCDHFAPVY